NFVEVQYLRVIRADQGELFEYKPPRIFIEWCANAPESKIGYILRSTETHGQLEINTNWEGHVRKEVSEINSNTVDYFRFHFQGFLIKVRFIQVEKTIPFSRKIALEYHSKEGNSPSGEQRKVVLELLSFLFGRHLLSVGYTVFESLPDQPDSVRVVS